MFNDLKPWHIIVIVVVFVALFGAKKLPDAARSIGKSMRIFKSEVRGMREDDATYSVQAESGSAQTQQQSQPLPASDQPVGAGGVGTSTPQERAARS